MKYEQRTAISVPCVAPACFHASAFVSLEAALISLQSDLRPQVAARLRDYALLGRISGMVSATSPAGLAIAQIKERVIGYGYGR